MNVIKQSRKALAELDWIQVDVALDMLACAKAIFCIGNGGGYAHAMHFASDLRKIAKLQAFSMDNGAEYTARVNDLSWGQSLFSWMSSFQYPRQSCCVFVFSVGGGDRAITSTNLSGTYGGGPLTGIVWATGGALLDEGCPIVIPSTSTPVVEGCQSVIAHHIIEKLCS